MIDKITCLVELILPKLQGGKQVVISVLSIVVITMGATAFEKYLDYKMDQMKNNVIVQMDTQVRSTITEVIDSTSTDYSNRINKAIEHYPEIDMRIDNLLDKLNTKLYTGKAAIGIYHDGTKTPTGNPFLKYTVTNEQIKERKFTIEKTMQLNQGVAYSRIAYYANEMVQHGYFICGSTSELKAISLPDYQAAMDNEIKSIAMFPIKNPNTERPMGFLILFSYDKKVNLLEYKDYIELSADLISQEIILKYHED